MLREGGPPSYRGRADRRRFPGHIAAARLIPVSVPVDGRLPVGRARCNTVIMTHGDLATWLQAEVPAGWFQEPPRAEVDPDEIVVVGALPGRLGVPLRQLVESFREETRQARMGIAQKAELSFGRRLSWAVEVGGERFDFTSLATPVMTRLRMRERQVLDTLVEASVARSRSEALAWCVKLVAEHEADWIGELREALVKVNDLRRSGPRTRQRVRSRRPVPDAEASR